METVSEVPDYRGKNLRRTSFRGMDMDGADFTDADLRGADFTDASLVGANFTRARFGVTPLVGTVLLAFAIVIAAAAGVLTGWAASEIRRRLSSGDWQWTLTGVTFLILGVLLLGFMLVKGFDLAIRAFAVAFSVAVVVDVIVVLWFGELNLGLALRTLGLILLFALAVVAGILGRLVGGTFSVVAIALVAVVGGVAAGKADGGIGTIAIGVLLAVISKRALRADLRDRPIAKLANRIVSVRGTRFIGADVTKADFTGTLLTRTDMSHAVLSEADWDPGKGPLILDGDT